MEARSAGIQLTTKLPQGFGAKAHVVHYRIDDTHGNAYTKWVELGKPQNPTAEMLTRLRTAMQLEMLEPAKVVEIADGAVTLGFELPRFGLSLVILEKSGPSAP